MHGLKSVRTFSGLGPPCIILCKWLNIVELSAWLSIRGVRAAGGRMMPWFRIYQTSAHHLWKKFETLQGQFHSLIIIKPISSTKKSENTKTSFLEEMSILPCRKHNKLSLVTQNFITFNAGNDIKKETQNKKTNQMDQKKREKPSLQPLQADLKSEKQVVLWSQKTTKIETYQVPSKWDIA